MSATNITDELVRQIVDDLRERYKLDHADVQALGARLARPSDNRTAENHDFAERFVEQHRETFDRLAQ